MQAERLRNRSCCDLLAMEFVEEGNTVKQFSPCKTSSTNAWGQARGPRRLFGDGGAPAGSPTAVADQPAYATASQPSSATSSLAAALADLQVSSRQSSAGDLGDRSRILAFAAAKASAAPAAHSRSSSGDELPGLAQEEGLCATVLIGAVRCFDSMVLKTLTPIKTRSRASSHDGAAASPPVAYVETLVSPFGGNLKPKGPMGRPVVYHSRGSSGMGAPGAYNPYDLTAAALSSEFRSPAKSMYSPYPSSSRTASASATPNQWGSGSYRGSAYRAAAQQQAMAQEEEPDYYVSVPGVRRQQSLSSSAKASQAAAAAAQQGEAQAAASGAASPTPLQRQPSTSAALLRGGSGGGAGLLRQASSGTASLGSGTAVHGFKGLFRSVIARGPSQ